MVGGYTENPEKPVKSGGGGGRLHGYRRLLGTIRYMLNFFFLQLLVKNKTININKYYTVLTRSEITFFYTCSTVDNNLFRPEENVFSPQCKAEGCRQDKSTSIWFKLGYRPGMGIAFLSSSPHSPILSPSTCQIHSAQLSLLC